ncbi:C39 family peptidase [Neobacillus sp. LXY-4]|uniref:C39 family peptidase n=1 Tax=Neobacillus sp. LXY-4 TaxID=3379826 RepID=UPI003EE27DAB
MKKNLFVAILLPLLGCSHQLSAESIHEKNKPKIDQAAKVQHMDDTQTTPLQVVNHKYLLDVPLIRQNPELKYGCEVTSLAMVLQYAGVKTNKMELFTAIKKDPDPIQRSRSGDILRWGNPADGFVGDMTGRTAGYAVFDKPMEVLVNRYLPGRAVNLTNRTFEEILQHIAKGFPVVVWTTGDFRLPDRPESWLHGNQTITTPLDLHAVVLVGYDEQNIYINDPLSGKKQNPVNKQQFIASWKALQSRAISYQ